MNSTQLESVPAPRAESESAPIKTFELDLLCRALAEAGKRQASAVNLLAFLLTIASIIVFAEIDEQELSIPVLGLTLGRWPAANVVLTLTCAAIYRFATMRAFEQTLLLKYYVLLRHRGDANILWFTVYPSFWSFHGYALEELSKLGKLLSYVPAALVFVGCVLYVPFLFYRVGKVVAFDTSWIVAACVSGVLVFAALTVIVSIREFSDAEATVARLERWHDTS